MHTASDINQAQSCGSGNLERRQNVPLPVLWLALTVGLALLPSMGLADVRLSAILSEHMVLRLGEETAIWGKADQGETITVTLGDVSSRTAAGKDGRWSVTLDLSRTPAGPFALTVEGRNRIVIRDVLVGEVWLASGQSNMAFPYNVKTKADQTAPLVRNSPDSELEGLAICGSDHQWVWAEAKIDGESVLVWSDKIPDPVAVRYAWADNPTCNLANGAGLPAAPFRTDDEPALTRDALY